MFGHDAGDMIINNHHLIDQPLPLCGKHTNRCRPTSNPHTVFGNTINDRRFSGLNGHLRPIIDFQLNRRAIAQIKQRRTGHPAFLLAATGQMIHPAQRQHL